MAINHEELQSIIEIKLKPFVKKIDEQAYYARDYLVALGKANFFDSRERTQQELLRDESELVFETAKVCMTTAFCLWCHLAALTYIRHTENKALKNELLPSLENGQLLGATGLSNPMKYYAELEKLYLTANKTDDGYIINGILPSVSNLADNHWFGIVAKNDEGQEIMAIVNTNTDGLTLKEKVDYLGVNGSATYSCRFNQVKISNQYVIAHNAEPFIDLIRPTFVLYQIPLGLGVIDSAIEGIRKIHAKQNGCNDFLPVQANGLEEYSRKIRLAVDHVIDSPDLNGKEICKIRLDTAYATLEAVQANMLHNGSAGYVNGSTPSRKLREAYFFASLTPTVRQLEKMKHSFESSTSNAI